MDNFLIKIYTEQVQDQLNEAEICFEKIRNNLTDNSVVFGAIHHFLIHVSNIVKLIQPNIVYGVQNATVCFLHGLDTAKVSTLKSGYFCICAH